LTTHIVGMIRPSISCMLAGLLAVFPALLLLAALVGNDSNGRWTLPYTMLLFCAVMGGLWLGEEIAEILRPSAAHRAKAPQGTFQ
jgi:hypothetical protein